MELEDEDEVEASCRLPGVEALAGSWLAGERLAYLANADKIGGELEFKFKIGTS